MENFGCDNMTNHFAATKNCVLDIPALICHCFEILQRQLVNVVLSRVQQKYLYEVRNFACGNKTNLTPCSYSFVIFVASNNNVIPGLVVAVLCQCHPEDLQLLLCCIKVITTISYYTIRDKIITIKTVQFQK